MTIGLAQSKPTPAPVAAGTSPLDYGTNMSHGWQAHMSRSRVTRVFVPLAVFTAVLLGIELSVRATFPHYPSRNFFLTLFGDPPDETPEEKVPLFEGDPVLFWRLRPNVERAIWDFTVVSTNPQGFRHPRPLGRKPPGRFRIVCLGDSVTFGYRIPLVFPDAPDSYDHDQVPYPSRLERILRAQYPEHDIEVITLAVPGYSTHQGLLLLERTISWLEPDVVVICFGFNDVARKHWPDEVIMARNWFDTSLRVVMSSSQTLLHAWRWWISRPTEQSPPPPPGPRVSQGAYVRNIERMVELAHEYGAEVLVIGPVYRDAVTTPPEAKLIAGHRNALRKRMRQLGVPYLQIQRLTEAGHPANASLFGELIHPSNSGHDLMRKRVYDALRHYRMLDDLAAG